MEQAPDPAFLSLVDLAEKLRGKAISPVEITRHMLDRIEKLEPRLHAYALVTAEAAPGTREGAASMLSPPPAPLRLRLRPAVRRKAALPN